MSVKALRICNEGRFGRQVLHLQIRDMVSVCTKEREVFPGGGSEPDSREVGGGSTVPPTIVIKNSIRLLTSQ